MKLHILSDVHNEFSILEPPKTDADVVILAGDIDVQFKSLPWAQSFNKPVIYVLGNHEFYGSSIEEIRVKTRKLTQNTNIHLLDDDELILDGVRFLGGTLWTDFNLFGQARSPFAVLDAQAGLSDFKVIQIDHPTRRFRPEDSQDLHQKTVTFLAEKLTEPFSGKTVVVTHHAPSLRSIESKYLNDRLTPCFASNLEGLFGEAVNLWIHGHVHHCNDYERYGTRVVSNPGGYQHSKEEGSENNNFDPTFIVEV